MLEELAPRKLGQVEWKEMLGSGQARELMWPVLITEGGLDCGTRLAPG